MSKEFYSRLAEIQRALNAPKNQYNSFGKYNYRSCEDILEGVKPLLNGLFLSISDDIVLIGDRYYVKATAIITDGESSHTASAMAREAIDKKGMDEAQITGATSSYARKYCLNGLFGIDDSKDADTDEHRKQQDAAPKKQQGSTSQAPQMTLQQALNKFTDAANGMDSAALETAYAWTKNKLAGNQELLRKAEDIYQIRKKELELPA
ncbi:ERF family protein [Chimaeribacter arupi]|uniref:ERF family protein n=1 Tax=Chimaeribacter arupi TaxID=2060066 RepID=UPI0027121B1E|nr:ERF family protein [Chimaeribacter arupi]WKZ93574.1 ERF family protein [Chimaeribacter arupi]